MTWTILLLAMTLRLQAQVFDATHTAKASMQSGFAMCCAMLIQPHGEAIIANAGHPSPYRDGRELETEPGLPVARGERFTFISDGVVEATNRMGESFGFDRTLEISGKSASKIAQDAKAWGQNDDITVVTVNKRNS